MVASSTNSCWNLFEKTSGSRCSSSPLDSSFLCSVTWIWEEIHSLINPLNKYLLSFYYMPATEVDAENIAVCKTALTEFTV